MEGTNDTQLAAALQ